MVESAAARVCREAGARVSLNVRVQDVDLARPDVLDNRRLEIVADGLLLFHGAQLAIDTRVAPTWLGLLLARRRKGTYPELGGEFGRARLVVLGCEAWGPSQACATFQVVDYVVLQCCSRGRPVLAGAQGWHRIRW